MSGKCARDRIAGLVLAVVLAPATLAAQSPEPSLDPPRETRGPGVSISLGLTGLVPADMLLVDLPRAVAGATGVGFFMALRPGAVGSVQVPIGGTAIIEGELARAAGQGQQTLRLGEYAQVGTPTRFVSTSTFSVNESRETVTVGANLLWRVGYPRVSTFLGGGPVLRRTAGSLDTELICVPIVAGGCDGRPNVEGHKHGTTTSPGVQVVYGLDATLTPRLAAFAAVRLTSLGRTTFDDNPLAGFGVASGVRVAIRQRRAPLQTLPEIRVTGINGAKRTAVLVSLSSAELVLRQGGTDLRVPLTDVRRVETVAHHVRNVGLLGLVSGGLLGVAIARSYSEEGRVLAPVELSAYGLGVGAAIGAIVNRATRNQHLLYVAPGSSGSVSVAPLLGLKRAGVGVATRW